jgi:hypothetical protein
MKQTNPDQGETTVTDDVICSSADVVMGADGERRLQSCHAHATQVNIRPGMVALPKCARHTTEDETNSLRALDANAREFLRQQARDDGHGRA